MNKELFVSSTPHETKVAVVEDDQVAELYFERENEYSLAGSIYKGRVTRVLPGMQSAFVDIGLERDAFLYVSDFLEAAEDQDDFEPIPASGRPEVYAQAPPATEAALDAPPPAEPAESGGRGAPQQTEADAEEGGRQWRGRRRRGRGRRGRGFPESKFAHGQPARESHERAPRESHGSSQRESYGPPPGFQPVILPGESISKYQHLAQAASAPAAQSTMEDQELQTAPGERESVPGLVASEPRFEEEREADAAIGRAADETRPPERDREEEEERLEQMNVASIFGGDEARPEQEQSHRESASEFDFAERETRARRHRDAEAESAAGQQLEEEEIEEEESEYLSPGEMLDEEEFEEMEEQTVDRGENGEDAVPAGELAAAVEESEIERAAEEGEEGDSPVEYAPIEGGWEGDADNGQKDENGGGEESEISGRAEVRGPAATAGYQQRAERPGFDRRGRRPMRGRGRRFRREQRPQQLISELLKEGQEILVQIAKEPIGKKGARITSHIALPGRFLVYMPTVNHIGVSRKISSEEERQRLKRIVSSERENGHGGFIVRTAADHAAEEELRADIRFLKSLWQEIKNRADSGRAPALIYHDLNLVERILRDQLNQNFAAVWVDTEQDYERITRFVSRFQPALVKRIKLYTKETPLFEQFGVQEEINKALKSKVWLKSGGYIVINQTEALVAIDVNTGKYVGKTARLEDTIFKTNVDAIREIVRQVRLRDLGGIIVIDFIDMDERRNRQKVMQALDDALRSDRAPSKVLAFNDFGLVAITRKRVKQSLERTLGLPCSYCSGNGFVKSPTTVCNEIWVEMRKMSRHFEGQDVMLRVNPEVAKALKANGGRWIQEMEELLGRNVIVKSDALLHQEQFDIH